MQIFDKFYKRADVSVLFLPNKGTDKVISYGLSRGDDQMAIEWSLKTFGLVRIVPGFPEIVMWEAVIVEAARNRKKK